MLEYTKTVLSKVSFDSSLFEKELRKALRRLIPEEILHLRAWCYTRFTSHLPILERCFGAVGSPTSTVFATPVV